MRGKNPVSLTLAVFFLASVWLLASCATQSGSTLKAVSSVEGRAGEKSDDTQSEKPPEKPLAKPPADGKKGLEIVSNPSSAEVILDNEFRGRTPLLLGAIGDGRHLIVLQKTGYHAVARWIDYSGDYMLYETALLPITGFLNLSVSPQETSVTLGDGRVSPGFSELPVGAYSVVARAFGYADYRGTISIFEKSLTTLDIALSPVPFDYTKLSAVRAVVNPDNPGVLGALELTFSVTGPGAGTLTVLDSSSRAVFTSQLPEFSTWDQSYRWNCSDDEGRPLPDGAYKIRLTGRVEGSDVEASREIGMRIDRSLRIAPRSLWSGAAGLLYAPSTEVLPAGAFQSALLAAAFANSTVFRAPVALSARLGLSGGVELDLLADIILSDTAAPFGGSFSARYALVSPRAPVGFGAALQTKLSVQYDPGAGVLLSDTLANFTGISLGLPLQLAAGPVSLLAAVDVVASLWEPYPEGPESSWRDPRITTWLYLRAGLLLDFGQIVSGLSVSARTSPLLVDPFGIALPVQAGAEIHWLIPNSHLLLSGILAAEVGAPSGFYGPDVQPTGFYLMGGGGLGFLY